MEVLLTTQARREFRKLPVVIRNRVNDVLERLEAYPKVSGVKWLTADWKKHARVRTGDYRVIFRVADDDLIEVVRVAHRRVVYVD